MSTKNPPTTTWDDRLPKPGSRWQHESRLGTYDCTIDDTGTITLIHRLLGWVRTVKGYDELKMVDVKPPEKVDIEPSAD